MLDCSRWPLASVQAKVSQCALSFIIKICMSPSYFVTHFRNGYRFRDWSLYCTTIQLTKTSRVHCRRRYYRVWDDL
jgi:hypothetical protein